MIRPSRARSASRRTTSVTSFAAQTSRSSMTTQSTVTTLCGRPGPGAEKDRRFGSAGRRGALQALDDPLHREPLLALGKELAHEVGEGGRTGRLAAEELDRPPVEVLHPSVLADDGHRDRQTFQDANEALSPRPENLFRGDAIGDVAEHRKDPDEPAVRVAHGRLVPLAGDRPCTLRHDLGHADTGFRTGAEPGDGVREPGGHALRNNELLDSPPEGLCLSEPENPLSRRIPIEDSHLGVEEEASQRHSIEEQLAADGFSL